MEARWCDAFFLCFSFFLSEQHTSFVTLSDQQLQVRSFKFSSKRRKKKQRKIATLRSCFDTTKLKRMSNFRRFRYSYQMRHHTIYAYQYVCGETQTQVKNRVFLQRNKIYNPHRRQKAVLIFGNVSQKIYIVV